MKNKHQHRDTRLMLMGSLFDLLLGVRDGHFTLCDDAHLVAVGGHIDGKSLAEANLFLAGAFEVFLGRSKLELTSTSGIRDLSIDN